MNRPLEASRILIFSHETLIAEVWVVLTIQWMGLFWLTDDLWAESRLMCAGCRWHVCTWACSWLGTALRPVAAMYVLPMVLIFSTPLNFGLDSSWGAMRTTQLLSWVLTQGQALKRHSQILVISPGNRTPLIHPLTLGILRKAPLHQFHKACVLGRKHSIIIYFQLARTIFQNFLVNKAG